VSPVEDARKRWVADREKYVSFASYVKDQIVVCVKPLGLWSAVSARAKEIDSLEKKLLRKPTHTYDTLPDKVGARVVLRYRSEIKLVLEAVQSAFSCESVEDKMGKLGSDRIGYLSVHVDRVRLKDNDPRFADYPPTEFWLELQVRTLAQDLWSEMSHDSVYKSEEGLGELPEDLRRRVNLMAGQIEVADREFDRLGTELPQDDYLHLLKTLEHHYYMFCTQRPDAELSLQVLRRFAPLYSKSVRETAASLQDFLTFKRQVLESVYSDAAHADTQKRSAFLFQPEVLLLYERLTNDESGMRTAWNQHYPEEELERIANTFGMSFD
jgi:ppGpp synthetase/RelA/SpoT-type nucleotidyltranferase